jgi:hypothetical protein
MKYDIQDCFHVSAAEADSWKRALATPAETDMMADAAVIENARGQNRNRLFGSLFRLPERFMK